MTMNRTGWFLVALFGGIGLVMCAIGVFVGGMAAGILLMIGVIWVLVAGGLVLYHRRQGRKAEHDRWLFENGLRGTATVVSASSGALINDQPMMSFVFDVEVPGRPPQRIRHRILMSSFVAHRMVPGVVLPIHVHPQKPGDVLVRW